MPGRGDVDLGRYALKHGLQAVRDPRLASVVTPGQRGRSALVAEEVDVALAYERLPFWHTPKRFFRLAAQLGGRVTFRNCPECPPVESGMASDASTVLAMKKTRAQPDVDPIEFFEKDLDVPSSHGDPVTDLAMVCDMWIRCSWRAASRACAVGITPLARPRGEFLAAVHERFQPVLDGAARRTLASIPPRDRTEVRRRLLQIQETLRGFHRVLDTDPLTLQRTGVSALAFPARINDQLAELRWNVSTAHPEVDDAPPKHRHLTERESQVWKALAGHRLIAKEIGEVITADHSSVRRAIGSMRRKGYEIRGGTGGQGYWRPDAPPFG